MKMMTSTAVVIAAVFAFTGCATMSNQPDATPVGTTGTAPAEPAQVASSEPGVIPVGQLLDVRLQEPLSSATATVEQRFETTTVVDLTQDGNVLVPAGSVIRGVVRSVEPAGRLDRTGSLTLAFDELVVKGEEHPIRANATQVFKSGGYRGDAGRIGTGGAVGAIVGGIIGGLEGALIGAVVGGGGVIAATEGKDVELPAGAIIRLRFDSPANVK